MTTNEKTFATICYLVLMNHHGQGIYEAHPHYVEEKLLMLNAGYDAYIYLDRSNQISVKNYLEQWKYELPEPIVKYENELRKFNLSLKNIL